MILTPGIPERGSVYPVELALQQICAQHRHLACVLAELEVQAAAIMMGQLPADFPALSALLRYLDVFAHGVHQQAEEEFLFSTLEQCGAPHHVVDGAMNVHRTALTKMTALKAELIACRFQPDASNTRFAQLLPEQISLEFEHISYEESVVLPCAIELLPAEEWPPIARAFRSHDDPLFGANPAPELASLHYLLIDRPDSLPH